ncbi:MAG: tetratricopeptide repeat protein, partial [Calditrichales bacterium]|nr:tetratricopeptide repeat protein [Calditrichales bacterium]
MRRLIYLIAPLIILNSLSAEVKTDSLETRLQAVSGEEKIEVLNKLSEAYKKSLPAKSVEYGKQALELSQKSGDRKGEALALLNIGGGNSLLGNYDKALEYFSKSLSINEKINDKINIAQALNNIGLVYQKLSAFDNALEYHLKALKIREAIEEKKGIAASLNNVGNVYWKLNDYDKALEYYQKSLKIYEELGNKNGTALSLNNIGNIYWGLNKFDKVLECFKKSLKIYEETDNDFGVAASSNNIGYLYKSLKNYDKALEYYLKSLKIYKKMGEKNGQANTLNNIGGLYSALKKYDKAESHLEQGLKLAKEIKAKDLVMNSYSGFFGLYYGQKDYKNTLNYYILFTQVKDSIFTKQSSDKIAEMHTKYETEKKEKEIEIQTLELSRQKLLRNLLIIGLAFILILAFVIYNRYRLKTKAHNELTKAHNELSEAKEVIEEKNDHIMSSIRYARKIQRAILPVDEKMKDALGDYFVIFKPQAIVSGDFYWFSQINDKIFIAVVDCTGHGVPGAFMSMIGNSLLNKIVNENKIFDPAVIMEHLHNGVRAALKQEGEDVETQDGMDVCLCVLENNKITFTGAKRPLYHIHNSELVEIKGDRKSIGGLQKEKKRKFTKNEIDINPGDIIYMTSDGFADQSDTQEKKYGSRRLKEYLQKNAKLSLGEQK